MILQRKSRISIPDLTEEDARLFQTEWANAGETLLELAMMVRVYNMAMKRVVNMLDLMDDEFQYTSEYDLIHHMESRIKAPHSIYRKLQKYQLPLSLQAARENIYDIAGIRVVCNFVNDIYTVEDKLLQDESIQLIRRRDFITHPKPNGYRSLHLVVKLSVSFAGKVHDVPLEIQLRTVAMDYWATLEHMLQYKSKKDAGQNYAHVLLKCAQNLADTEESMQFIRDRLEKE
ncbi:MAG: GTP pyrophosphokinase family protein [Tissierellia bacterium]|jgi:putative GTP pyrophosphokinase|nr:GTP pyrophosphokinase family protein [Tissierellia bacterium]